MAYKDLLKNIISKSELTLREISRRAKLEGLSITPSYLSQLQNGKVPPPNDEISRIIAKVCGVDNATELISSGYFEKSPDVIRDMFKQVFDQSAKIANDTIHKLDSNSNKDTNNIFMNSDLLSKLNVDLSNMNNDKLENIFSSLMDNTRKIFTSSYISDESMEPLIPKHAKLKSSSIELDNLKDGDVVIVTPKDSELKYIRSYYYKNGYYCFLSENRNFPFFIENNIDDFKLLGIVESYEVNIKK